MSKKLVDKQERVNLRDMAAEAIVSSAVQILSDLLIQKVKFLRGVGEQVVWLKDELERMKCFLKDAAEKQAKDERVRNWISEIREVAQDAEDAIQLFVLRTERARGGMLGILECCGSFPKHVHHLDKVGKEIELIRSRLQAIKDSCATYGIRDLGDGAESSGRVEKVELWRRLAPWQKDKHMVGLNEDVQTLLRESILNEEKKGLFVTTIVGMGGIGKSTLAKKLYNHAAVADRFKRRAWVVVSSEFTPEDIIRQIMLQLQISLSEDEQKELESIKDKLRRQEILQEILHKELLGNPYFIVLDDVWEHTHWESLRSAFPDQGETCRLLMTSRNQIMREHDGYIHKMRLLNLNESWELLLKTAFLARSDGRCPKELESIGEEILKRCGGLPLAIKVAGGLLASQGDQSLFGWERVLKQILETSDRSLNVLAILELSYLNLPPRLKPCFLCLAFFKEDEIIRAKRLVRIWLAQGFIASCEGNRGEEERARSYLDELINRNLVQDMGSTSGAVKGVLIHDLLRELAIRKAKEEIGFAIIRSDDEEGNSLSNRPLRHAVYLSGEGLLLNQSKHLRSLFLNDYPSGWLIHLHLLKTLDIDSRAIVWITFKEYRALIGLKYLRITGALDFELPIGFNRLKNLEVLEIEGYVRLSNHASWKMDSLRHFHAFVIEGILKKETWKNLETLKRISNPTHIPMRVRKLGLYLRDEEDIRVAAESLQKLENLTQLHLVLGSDFDCHPIFQAIRHMDHLTKLKLCGGRVTELESIKGIVFRTSLARERCAFPSGNLIKLGELPKLSHLKLSKICEINEMRVLRGAFPKLQLLSLHNVKDLHTIFIEEGGMPELRRVSISDCPKLDTQNLQQYLA